MASQPNIAAIILAGGRSSRLGRDKASERLLGRSLLQHVIDRVHPLVGEIIIVRARAQQLPEMESAAPIRIAEDDFASSGPLGGIYSGLMATAAERGLVVACDMPLLSRLLLEEMLRRSGGCDVVMPVLAYPEPLHAVYSRACIAPIRERIEAGQLKITNFLGAVGVCYMREDECRALDPDLRSFTNTNTEADLDRARRLLEEEERDGASG
jgi:molybdopterin-guanine dinucleotide biosynthesis protein A